MLSVAQGLAQRAISYAGKFSTDSCVAMNLLEEAAATVSETIRAKEADQIRSLPFATCPAISFEFFFGR